MLKDEGNEFNRAVRKHPYATTALVGTFMFVMGLLVFRLPIGGALAGSTIMVVGFLVVWRPGGPGNPRDQRPSERLNMQKVCPAMLLLMVATAVIAIAVTLASS